MMCLDNDWIMPIICSMSIAQQQAPLSGITGYLQSSVQCSLEDQLNSLQFSLSQQQQISQMNVPACPEYSYPPIKAFQATQQNCCIDIDVPRKTNCKNCGAALSGKHKCSYCNTYNE